MSNMNSPIILKKVKVHNLKGIDLTLPANKLIVFTGVSGSGKSSLAFDTIFVEGQRRYIESLSSFAKHYIGDFTKPDVESISGLSPTLSIEQKIIGKNPRSTVGTMTEIYDYLRVLYARIGIPHCPISGEEVAPQSSERILKKIQSLPDSTKILFLSPIAQNKKGEFKELLSHFLKIGFTKARINDSFVDISEDIHLDKNKTHTIDIVIDRITINPQNSSRIAEAILNGLEHGKGTLYTYDCNTKEETFYSTYAYSHKSQKSYPCLEPHHFSFNTPSGMCEKCHGLGTLDKQTCPFCNGSRISSYPAAATLCGKTIYELCSKTIEELYDFFKDITLEKTEYLIAQELIEEIRKKLRFLLDIGLDYLCLSRSSETLSNGEAQRVKLAAQLGCGLVGVTYILDEPSIGLHPRDNQKLINTLKKLRDLGNTVIVVEHDEDMICEADHIVDFGPGAGILGGNILVNGSIKELLENPLSLTGQYLSKKKEVSLPRTKTKQTSKAIEIVGACHNNLKNITVSFPMGCLVAVTGVSGSGKSSLVIDTLYPAIYNHLKKSNHFVGKMQEINGLENIDKVIAIDQSPIGRTPRSNPATYIKIFDPIRNLFAKISSKSAQDYDPGRFSLNIARGSCSLCLGLGVVRVNMDFMEDKWITCERCNNKKFDFETLSITYKGKNINDILEMSVAEAEKFFHDNAAIKRKLAFMKKVGLDYLQLGQPSNTLSGGEAQRIKLARELMRPSSGKTLYILDEPTTGLHFHDIKNLMFVLLDLVERGNSVLLIEHNMDVIKGADWVIDLGPDGGERGGKILGEGPPEFISTLPTPTGIALKAAFSFRREIATKNKETFTPSIKSVEIEGASQNNLKYLDVSFPQNSITVCMGPSGSGKSSFAFETVYAEGQRRYVESLPPYARQFIQLMPKPKCTHAYGLSPSVAIEQKNSSGSNRSTVGTLTEIYDYLRIIFARMGIAYCPESGEPIQSVTKEYVVEQLFKSFKGESIMLFSPISLRKGEEFEHMLDHFKSLGYVRLRLDKEIYEIDAPIPLDNKRKQDIAIFIDRIKVEPSNKERLREAVENAVLISNGKIIVTTSKDELIFNLSFSVIKTGKSYPEITPHTFSFNSHEGMCLDCNGLGYKHEAICSSCNGSRLNPLARNVRIEGYTIDKLCKEPIPVVYNFIRGLSEDRVLDEVLKQIEDRLNFLEEVGLSYLSLDRRSATLSNGEAQRIRLAKQLGSRLRGVLYVLDEPTIGLHKADNERLNCILKKLRDLGNTLLLVEHDADTIALGDYLLDFGPGAGIKGGHITARGSYEEIISDPKSLSGAYLSGRKKISCPTTRRKPTMSFSVKDITLHNLKNISCEIPIGIFTGITGVSGSGKSSLMQAINSYLSEASIFNKIIVVNQDPIGHTKRADVGTYVNILQHIRKFYSLLAKSRVYGLQPYNFSYNHPNGMCKSCSGLGYKKVNLLFLPSVDVPCDHCHGLRLNQVSLDVEYKNKNFGQILDMTIEEIHMTFFDILPKVRNLCETLISVGLGYLQVGQELSSLSGGEAQRMKLSRALSTCSFKNNICLLDEPTTGLHPCDIEKLLILLHGIVDKGNTILLIEHNMDIIRNCDHLIEMGPGAGEAGGEIICTGSPEDLAKDPKSLIGKY